jgi:hypothetical protein
MDGTTVLWIVLAIAVVLVFVAVFAVRRLSSIRRTEHDHEAANDLRRQAASSAPSLDKHEAVAREVEARARKARAESGEKAAEADRLDAGARERQRHAERYRNERDGVLRRAAELDESAGKPSEARETPDSGVPHVAADRPDDRSSTGEQPGSTI